MALSSRLDERLVRSVGGAIREASMVICALECPHASVKEAFRIARVAAVTTILNPAPADGIDDELLGLADIVVANEHEAALLTGTAGTPQRLATALADRLAPALVVVTAGENGAAFARDGLAPGVVPAPRVRVVDTTGAGDAFLGAFAASLGAGADIADAVQFGVEVASSTVSRPGSIASYPTAAALEAAMAGARA
jgi:ribokinase